MRVVGVDERDSSWEEYDPTYRVYIFRGGQIGSESSWTTSTYDIQHADVLEVAQWARENAGPDPYAVAVVSKRHDRDSSAKGLTWLIGTDLNSEATDEHQADSSAA